MTTLEALDFFHGEEMIADPYPVLRRMREISPVLREPVHDVLVVTGYDEVLTVVGDPETFSSCTSTTGFMAGFPVPLEGRDDAEVRALIEAHRDSLPFSDQLPSFDPPKHTAHRSLLSRLITPKRLKENEEFMWRLADRVLDPYLAGGGGEFIRAVATPFALLVIADLLGVPEDDHAELAAELTGDVALGSADGQTAMAHSPLEYLYARFAEYIAQRREAPRGDVMTEMALATFPDGSTPEVIDVVRVAANLFSAGQETTVRLLSSGLKLLAENSGLQERMRRTPGDIPNFVEETLRFESPIKGDFRLARATTTVGGVDVPAGATLMVHFGAANRDPRIFENPDTFDPDRANARRHIGFGRGVHSCIGAPLARAEGRVLIQRLLERTTEIAIDDAAHGPRQERRFDYVPTYILRGLTELHVAVR
ncbi:cytochrome P450 [Mycolicibacterium parafortuitum]|uniref:Cytochrome P450 [Frankia sp. EAN1pec] n=1 Tax=Mycolicibacterium parafortuitum TaxID=39692 RepID=A0A375YDA6_MYCPF|nr:cytochrome P450 [Mycolicibacterium parafortuitum]ORB31269.1 cytochrome [Mycolicibacterium parafortuitum]SRX79070.1 cytochrome P450 [Frankia sp. EAN1pec] [Mycolicibacterium parafortuitum]